jgi:hypothetical protein
VTVENYYSFEDCTVTRELFAPSAQIGQRPSAALLTLLLTTYLSLSLFEALQSRSQGSTVPIGLDEHGHEHWLGQIRVPETVEEALILREPVSLHRGYKLLLG